MKITLKKIIYLIAFIGFTFSAKAQNTAVPDTARLTLGLDLGKPSGNLGNSYKFDLGASLQYELPLTEKFYFTANVGFDSYFPNNNVVNNPIGLENVAPANMDLIPLRVGIKYFLIRTFYVQGEVGESYLLNKSAVYGLDSFGLTYSPQIGLLFKLHNRKYIDAGFRYEWQQSFYGDGGYNHMLALRVAYGLNL